MRQVHDGVRAGGLWRRRTVVLLAVGLVAAACSAAAEDAAEEPELSWDGVWPKFSFPGGGPRPPRPPPPGAGDIVSQGYPPAPPPPPAPAPPPPPPPPARAASMFGVSEPPGGEGGGSGAKARFKESNTLLETDGRRVHPLDVMAHTRAYAAAAAAADAVAAQLRKTEAAAATTTTTTTTTTAAAAAVAGHPTHTHPHRHKGKHQQTLEPASFVETGEGAGAAPRLRGAGGAHSQDDGAAPSAATTDATATLYHAALLEVANRIQAELAKQSAYKVKRAAAGEASSTKQSSSPWQGAASLLELHRSLPPWAFASPYASLSPHQFRWNTLPGPFNAPYAAPMAPEMIPLGSVYGPDKIATPGASGSGSGSGGGDGKTPKYPYYDPYHPPPHMPYGWQPYSPYHPMYHPLPPAGVMPPDIPGGYGPGMQANHVYRR